MKQQRRQQLLEYLLNIATHQEKIQDIQNQLVTHLRFNPRTLFRHITEGNPLTFQSFQAYVRKELNLKQNQLLAKYFHKYFKGLEANIESFCASLLPYTPNVLRELGDKLERQLQTKYCDHTVIKLYHALLQAEFNAILDISAQQITLRMPWTELSKFILKDLKQFGKRSDVHQGWELNAVQLRNWMELWTEVNQYRILNLVRWFSGHQEKDIRRIYNQITSQLHCMCDQGHKHRQFHEGSLLRELSVSHKNPSSKCSQGNKEQPMISKVKSASRLLVIDPKQWFKLFIRYVQTIIKTEKRLCILRQGLRPYKQQTQTILHEITSKKSPSTRLGPLIDQMNVVLRLQQDVYCTLIKQLQNTKISNSFIYSLFASKEAKPTHSIKKQQLLTEIFQVIYTFCLSKATLKSLAKDLQGRVEALFLDLDENSHGYLDKTDLRLILGSSKVVFKQKDLSFLMSHFGDGQLITCQSLKEALRIQRNS